MNTITPNVKLKNWQVLLICLLISFFFLMICSNNSFLYAFNDNQDINWYITMGNGLLNGKLPYRDLFEHKGPILYLVFAVFCLFPNPYRVVFFFEVFCLALFLYFGHKLLLRFVSERISIFTLTITTFVTLTCLYFMIGGGAVEEYMLPIFMYMLLCFVEFVHDKKDFSIKRPLTFGVLIGTILLVKFTLLVLPFIMFVTMCVIYLRDKRYKPMFRMIAFHIIGVLIVAVPVFIYFGVNNALLNLFEVYFYDNLFVYSAIVNTATNLLIMCFVGLIPFSFGVIGLVLYRKKYSAERYKNIYTILFIIHVLALALTGNFSYYYLPLCIYTPLGIALLTDIVSKKKPKLLQKSVMVTLTLVMLVCSIFFGNGTRELDDKRSDYIHFDIASDIRAINNQNPTLFCYEMWDYGFYNTLGVTPNIRFFANSLFDEETFPEMYDSFDSYITTQATEFVLVDKTVYQEEYDMFNENYHYINEYFYLYRKDNHRSFNMHLVLLHANNICDITHN